MQHILYILSIVALGMGVYETVFQEYGSALFFAGCAIILLQMAILWKDHAPQYKLKRKVIEIPFPSFRLKKSDTLKNERVSKWHAHR